MLVLSRRLKERIRLGDGIIVTILDIARDRVRVGIEAPSNVLVLRDELKQRPRKPLPGGDSQESSPAAP